MAREDYSQGPMARLFEGAEKTSFGEGYNMGFLIRGIPDYLRNLASDEAFRRTCANVAKHLAGGDVNRVVVTGCGTSFHAALGLLDAIRQFTQIPGTAITPFEIVNYPASDLSRGTCVLSFSHSGRAKISVDATRTAKSRGCSTVAFTSLPGSPLERESDFSVVIPGGREPALPKTKSYVCALWTIYRLVIDISRAMKTLDESELKAREADIASAADEADRVILAMDAAMAELAKELSNCREVIFIGAGPNYPTAMEAALKFQETNYTTSQGEELEEMAHGPLAELDEASVLAIIAPKGPSVDRAIDLAKAAKLTGARVVAFTTDDKSELAKVAQYSYALEEHICETFSPLLYILPLYLWNYHLALVKGTNPDLCRCDEPKYKEVMDIVFPPGTH
ncbi:MAG TPA: SIS domain-containing protein [Firmicutes bacterium]|nr:SIS domain-containing protein [Bacillota bacterium]